MEKTDFRGLFYYKNTFITAIRLYLPVPENNLVTAILFYLLFHKNNNLSAKKN